MMDDYSPEPKWYVAHTYSGYENKVMEDIKKIVENRGLQDVVTDVRIPMLVTVEMVMNDFTWHIVRNIRGVTGFVGPGSKPVALTDAEVAQWGLEPEGEAEPVVKKSTLGFAVGDTVKVKEGVMLGITEVKVLEISSDEQKITCSAFMFGRETVVELDASDVSPIE